MMNTARLALRAFTGGMPSKSLGNVPSTIIKQFSKKTAGDTAKFSTAASEKAKKQVAQQIENFQKLGYHAEDISVRDGKRAFVNPEKITNRIFDEFFKKSSRPAKTTAVTTPKFTQLSVSLPKASSHSQMELMG
jgi:hypothetical protein